MNDLFALTMVGLREKLCKKEEGEEGDCMLNLHQDQREHILGAVYRY